MTQLSAQQLFQPASQQSWLATLLQNAATLKLKTTQWQPGGITRTILAVVSWALQIEDVNISLISQGGFLDFAASGSVTYLDVNGNTIIVYVTPDPSNPAQNPTGVLGWLDLLADSVFDVSRNLSTFSGGTMALLNTSANTYGPFLAGNYHVADIYPTPNPTYSNVNSLTIPASTQFASPSTNAIAAVVSSGSTNLIKVTMTSAHGLVNGAVVALQNIGGVFNTAGQWTYSMNGSSVLDSSNNPSPTTTFWTITVTSTTAFTLNGSQFSGTYTSGGLGYIPTIAAFEADAAGSESNSVSPVAGSVPVFNTITQPVTSLVGVTVGNTTPFVGSDTESNTALAARCRLKLQSLSSGGLTGLYEYLVLNAQTYAPQVTQEFAPFGQYAVTLNPTRVTVSANLGLMTVTFTNAVASVSANDLDAVAAILRAYTPYPIIPFVSQAAPVQNVAVVVTVWCPSTQATTTNNQIIANAITNFFSTVPIGGLILQQVNGYPPANIIPVNSVLDAIYTACAQNGIVTTDVLVLLNGLPTDLVMSGTNYVAALPSAPVVTMIGGS